MSPSPDPAAERLNGWKEIAAHVGKGVRTVQRWERQFGFPVHRLGRDGGEIVFGLRSEIDTWLLAHRGEDRAPGTTCPPAATEAQHSPVPATPESTAIEPRSSLRWRPRTWIAVAALLATVAVTLALGMRHRDTPQPASVRQEDRYLVALDSGGKTLWKFEFPAALAPELTESEHHRLALADVDRDGGTDVLLNATGIDRESPAGGLWAIDGRGREKFHVMPTGSVRFGREVYAGPWLGHHTWVLDDGRERSIWASFIHGQYFPTVLIELDAAGVEKARYWSNGYITSVKFATWGGRRVVLVGAMNNETKGASLAVFERDKVAGSAPAAKENYRCVDCPAGSPESFFVFPRRCIGELSGGASSVLDAWVDDRDILTVIVSEGPVAPATKPAAISYTVRADLTPVGADIVEHEAAVHAQLEKAGLLDHPFDHADAERAFPMLRWAGEGFVQLPRAPVSR